MKKDTSQGVCERMNSTDLLSAKMYPHLTGCLSFVREEDRKRYEEMMMEETPVKILTILVLGFTVSWGVIMATMDTGATSLIEVTSLRLTCVPLAAVWFYCYTVWHFQSHKSEDKLSDISANWCVRFLGDNISVIGNFLILSSAFVFGAISLLNSIDEVHEEEEDFFMKIMPIMNFGSLLCVPILFPCHSFPVSVLAVALSAVQTIFTHFVNDQKQPPLIGFLFSVIFCLYFVNVGNKKRYFCEIELRKLTRGLVNAEEENVRIQGQTKEMHLMIGSMSHDLRTPLQAFAFELDNIQYASKSFSSPNKLPEFKATMESNVTHLKAIVSFMTVAINRSLDYTKVSTGVELSPSVVPVDLTETLAWVLGSLSHRAKDSVQMKLDDFVGDVNNFILTDKQWLVENLFCFLSNAQKFTSEGEISIRCVLPSEDCPVEATHKYAHNASGFMRHNDEGQRMLILEVEDSGIGLSDDQKMELFRPFKQAQRGAGGTGLGLFSLLKRVERLGGQCGIRDRHSNQNGSVFWFSIPYVPDMNLSEQDISLPLSPTSVLAIPPSDFQQIKKILVVDDSILIQKATKRSLERQGYEVDIAGNGYECLKMINSTENVYDLILLDINMPILDGLETVKRIRSQESKARFGYSSEDGRGGVSGGGTGTKPSVVIAFSANSDEETKAVAMEAGMDAFLSKPLSPQDLKSACIRLRLGQR